MDQNDDEENNQKNQEINLNQVPTLSINHTNLTAVSSGIDYEYSFEYSSNASVCSSNEGPKDSSEHVALEKLVREREIAREEAQGAKTALSDVMEVVRFMTRQIKRVGSADFVQRVDSFCLPSDLSIDGDNDPNNNMGFDFDVDLNQHLNDPHKNAEGNDDEQISCTRINTLKKEGNRERTFSGVSACSIASYTNDDNQRFSELLHQSFDHLHPEFSKIGSDLIALNGACRGIEQNARLVSEESESMLRDLRQAHAELNELYDRCTKAEKCAKQLYKENKIMKEELETIRTERKILKREIKTLWDDKKARESFQQELLDSLKAHEDIMIKQAALAKDSVTEAFFNAVTKDSEALSDAQDDKNSSTRSDDDKCEDSIYHHQPSRLNPFGKFFSSLSGVVPEKDQKGVGDDSVNNEYLSTPVTPLESSVTPPTPLSPSLVATMLQAPDFNDDTPDTDSAVLTLTPTTPSKSDGMKSILSAKDLNPGENGLKPSSKDVNSWRQRKVNSSSPSSKSSKRNVVVVKLPNSLRNKNTPIASNITVANKSTKKQYRHYTIGAK